MRFCTEKFMKNVLLWRQKSVANMPMLVKTHVNLIKSVLNPSWGNLQLISNKKNIWSHALYCSSSPLKIPTPLKFCLKSYENALTTLSIATHSNHITSPFQMKMDLFGLWNTYKNIYIKRLNICSHLNGILKWFWGPSRDTNYPNISQYSVQCLCHQLNQQWMNPEKKQ